MQMKEKGFFCAAGSPPRLRRGCGAQRHWGGASRCDPATDLAFRDRSNHPAVAYGRGFPSLSKEGSSACRVSRQKLSRGARVGQT
jgi:hypothetical protein